MSLQALLNYPYQFLKHPYVILLIIPLAIILFIVIRRDFVKLKKELIDPEIEKSKRKVRSIMIITRILIFLLLFIAIASPYVERETLIEGEAFLQILIDNTTSFQLFDTELGERLREELSAGIRVEVRTIGGGNHSALGDALLSSMQSEGHVLLVSDGNTNLGSDLGDVALYATRLNTSISAMDLSPIHTDSRVRITGRRKMFEGSDYEFKVHVLTVGDPKDFRLIVQVDGQTIFDEVSNKDLFEFSQQLPAGFHRVSAEIQVDDYFQGNNKFYKTVKVVEKPKIFFWTKESSPLMLLYDQIFVTESGGSIPEDLSSFYSVVVNNANKNEISEGDIDRLTDFISDGNGMFVVGGKNAFERGGYKDSRFETLLPVFVAEPGKKEGDVNIVIVIDISGSTGRSVGTEKAVDIEKAQAVSIYNDLKPENRLAVVAFNTQGHVIERMSYIYEKAGLVQKISALTDGGGTLISVGLLEALELLKPTEGSKHIILISDGITQLFSQAKEAAELAERLGVKIFTVGVGPQTNDHIMNVIAQIGHGIYFKADQSNRLKILFGEPEEGDKGVFGLSTLDSFHPITLGLEDVTGTVTGFNKVVPKSTAALLVTTDVGDPILSSWRFGLGRIAALSTDDGTSYAGDLLRASNSPLLTNALIWTIGDPERKKKQFVDVEDTRINEPTMLTVKTQKPPVSEGLVFFKIEEEVYQANIVPTELGFYQVLDGIFGVNYESELADLGISPTLPEVVASTGGSMFKADEIDRIIDEVRSKAKRSVVKKVNIRWPFIILAIIIFLLEIALRKGYRKTKK